MFDGVLKNIDLYKRELPRREGPGAGAFDVAALASLLFVIDLDVADVSFGGLGMEIEPRFFLGRPFARDGQVEVDRTIPAAEITEADNRKHAFDVIRFCVGTLVHREGEKGGTSFAGENHLGEGNPDVQSARPLYECLHLHFVLAMARVAGKNRTGPRVLYHKNHV